MDTIDTKTGQPNDDPGKKPADRTNLEYGLNAANAARERMIKTWCDRKPLKEWATDDFFRHRHNIVISVSGTLMRYTGVGDTNFEPIY